MTKPTRNQIKYILERYRKSQTKKSNSLYYDDYFHVSDMRQTGVVQSDQKSRFDHVCLDGTPESIHLFGFSRNEQGTHFELTLTIAPLNDNKPLLGQTKPQQQKQQQQQWSLARAKFVLCLTDKDNHLQAVRYTYEHEQVLDYNEKRQEPDKHENKNIYRLGCLSVETVLPYSLTRILLNGTMRVETLRGDGEHGTWKPVDADELTGGAGQFKPMRVAISTHPTCDKFHYPERFDIDYQSDLIFKSLASGGLPNQRANYMQLALSVLSDDRLEQPLMFQGSVENLEQKQQEKARSGDKNFIMWGAKVKQRGFVSLAMSARDCLFAWSQCGQQIHLSRRTDLDGNLLNGMVHSSYDYASPLYDAKLYKRLEASECCPSPDQDHDDKLEPLEFGQLNSFAELTFGHVIKVRAFQKKEFTLEFLNKELPLGDSTPVRIKINGFDGWARRELLDRRDQLEEANCRLQIINLHDQLYTPLLAHEALLGGKGHSLVQLVQTVRNKALPVAVASGGLAARGLSVPRGLVITSDAYRCWLEAHGDELAHTLRVLDARRLELAARSALNQDPLSSEHVSASEAQRRLAGLCESTRAQLLKYQLPEPLRDHLKRELELIFGPLGDGDTWPPTGEPSGRQRRLFAVRSSCVGEDSLETSAAGQMRTILDASSFSSICAAVVECWTSQFELEALTYKSQNGLAFNLPMAVVVQELVECYAAGVAATCDPLTGNLERLEITANLGQGEGVVGGKQTDTMRISLERLAATSWNALSDEFESKLELNSSNCVIEKLPAETEDGDGDDAPQVCLSDAQILALGNLLLALRRTSGPMRQREVEWAITLEEGEASQFHVHLLQSRPLTHLARLSTRELDHELDSGLPCTLDHVSRANLGEVMPGAMCPINSSWFLPLTATMTTRKPYEQMHSRQIYVGDNFAHYARMVVMIVTYGDAIKRFGPRREPGAPVNANEDTTARDVVYSMIGSTFEDPKDEVERALRERFIAEKVNPNAPDEHRSFARVLATDAVLGAPILLAKRSLKTTLLTHDLVPIEQLAAKQVAAEGAPRDFNQLLNEQINKLYVRLMTRTECVMRTWLAHILATLTNMTLNAVALKLMSDQPAYKEKSMIATEVLNDFSVLMRGQPEVGTSSKSRRRKTTESGDISKLIQELLDCFVEEKRIEYMQTLSLRELHDFLNDPANVKKLHSCKLYARFVRKNGHRAYKEFDFATRSWSDDQSYIVRLLATRLKGYSHEQAMQAQEKRLESERLQTEKLAQISAKFTSNKLLLMGFAVPRARNAAIRREGTKSLLIKCVHKYRLAFRHLGGLLCLAGLLPSADLIFYLAMEEIDEIVRRCCSVTCVDSDALDRCARADVMPRLLYKARRRQQRTRAYDRVTFPRPTMTVAEMLITVCEQTEEGPLKAPPVACPSLSQANGTNGTSERVQVTGITSCAGCVTGRACVIGSLDELDEQLQPGDILITYSTDISWSVYFYQLAGVVTEVGGIVSHGAVVAREYGLPTLCTAIGACSKFRTGQLVTLDASRGVCYLATNQGGDNDDDDDDDKDCCATTTGGGTSHSS